MSQSTSDASNCVVMVNLNDLNKPNKLSKWIRVLPYYKNQYLQAITNETEIKQDNNQTYDIDNDDIIICNQLSEFIYVNQLTGYNFINNFTKIDFENIITIINDSTTKESTYNINKFEWIWKCIQYSKTNTYTNTNSNKLQWIYNSWTQFQIIHCKSEQEIAIETQPENPMKSDDNKQNENSLLTVENNGKYITETQIQNVSKSDENKQNKENRNAIEKQVENNDNMNVLIGVNDGENRQIIDDDANIDNKNSEVIEEQKHLENDKYIESNEIENDSCNDKLVESGKENKRTKRDNGRHNHRSEMLMKEDDENQCTICGCFIC